MANIIIGQLAGTDLLEDSESFLNELTDREMSIMGGGDNIVSIYSDKNDNNDIDLKTVFTEDNDVKIVYKKKVKKYPKKH